MAKVKVGVVGCGVMGSFHIKKASLLKECSLIGVFDADQERAKKVAEENNTKAFETLDELLKNCEAVIIASKTSTHFEIAKLAISKKVFTLIEKPMAQNPEEAKELLSLIEENKALVGVGMIERFNPAFSKVLSLVKREKILGIEIKRVSPFPERISDASVVWDMMIHDLDLALVLGKTRVESMKSSGKKIKSDKLDEAETTLYFKDGTICKIYCNRAENYKKRDIVITTESGIYEADLLNKKLHKREFATLINKEEIELKIVDQLEAEQKDFYLAIQNKRDPKCPAKEALDSIVLASEVEKQCLSE